MNKEMNELKIKKSKIKNNSVVKKQKKKVFRTKEPLIAVFMWSVNHTCNELKHVSMPEFLMPDDFKSFLKVKKDNQFFNQDVLPSHYKLKEYCPLVFKNLRERFNIDDYSYEKSLTHGEMKPIDSSCDKSNAKYYVSYDKKYIIKSISSDDVSEMHHVLTDYHKHIVETKGDTLLPHFLSMYRLTVEDKENYLLVMRNVFSGRLKIHKKYDLKGSSVDRAASNKEKEKDTPTFKDNDLISEGRSIQIGSEAKRLFMEKLIRDVDFLCSLNIMGYSLLIGVHEADKLLTSPVKPKEKISALNDNLSSAEETEDTDDDMLNFSSPTPPESPIFKHSYGIFGIPSEESKKEVYYMGIIDILTHYGLKKRSANVAKTVKYGADQEISTVKPEQYSKRFIDFINKIIE